MTHIWPKTLAKRDIGHIWESGSNRTYNFVYSVITILKIVVDERLVNQRGVWDGSSEVRCEDWVRNGKVIRTSGFGVVLMSVRTWRGRLGARERLLRGWMICCRKKRKSGVWCSGDTINLLSGAYSLGRIILGCQVPWIVKFEVVRWEILRMYYLGFFAGRTAVVEWAVE